MEFICGGKRRFLIGIGKEAKEERGLDIQVFIL